MIRPHQRSTPTNTRLSYTTLFRSPSSRPPHLPPPTPPSPRRSQALQSAESDNPRSASNMSACESHERPESIKSKCTKQIWPGSVWNWELQVGVLRIHTSRNSCGVFTFLTSELIGAHPVTAHRKGAHRIAAQ